MIAPVWLDQTVLNIETKLCRTFPRLHAPMLNLESPEFSVEIT